MVRICLKFTHVPLVRTSPLSHEWTSPRAERSGAKRNDCCEWANDFFSPQCVVFGHFRTIVHGNGFTEDILLNGQQSFAIQYRPTLLSFREHNETKTKKKNIPEIYSSKRKLSIKYSSWTFWMAYRKIWLWSAKTVGSRDDAVIFSLSDC